MTKLTLLIIALLGLISSCNTNTPPGKVKINSTGDTLEIVKTYPSDSIKEIIIYGDNKSVDNIGFYPNGDTIKIPSVVYTNQDNNLFVFIPCKLKICSYSLKFGVDSAMASDQILLDKFYKLTDSIHAATFELKNSTDIKLNPAILRFGISKGVLKCKMDTGCRSFKYYPFDLNLKDHH